MGLLYPIVELDRDQRDAILGTSGTPTEANKFVTSEDSRLLINDTNHGNRSGGLLHEVVSTSTAGFMSAADKIALDGFAAAGSGSVQDADYAERNVSVLLGTTNVVYLTLTTASMTPGTFRYAWAYTQRVTSNNNSVIVDVYVDNVLISTIQLAAFQSAGSQIGSGFRYIPDLDTQVHTLQLQARCTGGSCYIDRADLEFWRKV